MSSSTDNSDNISSRAECDMEDDSADDTAAKQLALQIENLLTIENEEGDIATAMTSINNADKINSASTCAACGKEGKEGRMNMCNKCKMVHYCNVTCKKKHKSKHKKKCDRRVAELHDEELFKDPPPREECPICMLPLPLDADQSSLQSCCGKYVCNGCTHAMVMEEMRKGKKNDELGMCAFCRSPHFRLEEEVIKRMMNLVENGNADAFDVHAGHYAQGLRGMPQDWEKANESWLTAGELGCAQAYYNLGGSYYDGMGVEIDKMKAKHYWELAAMNGNVMARHNLGLVEGSAGNYHRAKKHFIIAARAGFTQSLDQVKRGFMEGLVTKDEYESTLRAYHNRQAEMKSDMRADATAFREWNG